MQEALDVIMEKGDATVVVIAHRLSTIRNADMIAVVDQGKVIETGTHEELISQSGKYYDLVEAQKGKHGSAASTDSETESSDGPSRSSSQLSLNSMDDEDDEMAPSSAADKSSDGVVSLDHVHFSYPSRPDNKIFRGLGLEVQRGETVAIVGPSGQGKSTIIQLIEEFYRPAKGGVAYNGDDLKDLNVKWYRNEIGLVSQEPTLFDITIAENIKFGMPNATQEQIEDAAKKANAHSFISEFPDGYNTLVGTAASSQISGGQKQRIAIARALLRKPKVLLLDEATSALDSESEQVVQEALDKIMEDKSLITIVIAHRLSTIRGADKIAYVSYGKVREIGTYEELMAKEDGLYKRLEALQTLDQDQNRSEILGKKTKIDEKEKRASLVKTEEGVEKGGKEDEEDKERAKANEKRAKALARSETRLFAIGSFGAVLNGIIFPGQGFVFAYMLEVLYAYALPCQEGVFVPDGFVTCQDYRQSVADDMKQLSLKTIYLLIALIFCSMTGSIIMYKSFGMATERINKRVRDDTFKALLRQEVAWYDLRSVGEICTQLSDDAAMIHSFSGEPIRTFAMTIASVGAGLACSFIFMWEVRSSIRSHMFA